MAMPTCWRCGNKFPRSDKRGFVSRERSDLATCPLCNVISIGANTWAIANDCNGIFCTEVYSTKAAALAECAKPQWQGCEVVPVVTIRDPGTDEWRRDWDEKQRDPSPTIDRAWA